MATIQIRVDDAIKASADDLFNSLGLDTSTAIRMFLSAAINSNGIPFNVRRVKEQEQIMIDEEVMKISDKIMKKNHEAYKVLAK